MNKRYKLWLCTAFYGFQTVVVRFEESVTMEQATEYLQHVKYLPLIPVNKLCDEERLRKRREKPVMNIL